MLEPNGVEKHNNVLCVYHTGQQNGYFPANAKRGVLFYNLLSTVLSELFCVRDWRGAAGVAEGAQATGAMEAASGRNPGKPGPNASEGNAHDDTGFSHIV